MMKLVRWSVGLTVEDYVHGLAAIEGRVTDKQRSILIAHYNSSERTNYAKRLAELAGIATGHGTVNLEYWRLAEAFCKAANQKPDIRKNGKPRWWSVWSQGYRTRYGYMWQMLPQVAKALEILRWIDSNNEFWAEEKGDAPGLFEGDVYSIPVNLYERNPRARQLCLAEYGYDCVVCGFNFKSQYGSAGDDFIHVHHLTPVSDVGCEYQIDPVCDLRPVCANCHGIIHRRSPPYSIEEVREFLVLREGCQ